MLFGPSDSFGFPICLSVRFSHRFVSCSNGPVYMQMLF
jgi:hypothetical protein